MALVEAEVWRILMQCGQPTIDPIHNYETQNINKAAVSPFPVMYRPEFRDFYINNPFAWAGDNENILYGVREEHFKLFGLMQQIHEQHNIYRFHRLRLRQAAEKCRPKLDNHWSDDPCNIQAQP